MKRYETGIEDSENGKSTRLNLGFARGKHYLIHPPPGCTKV